MTTPGPARLIGRYLLFGEIASGGMATVHFGRLSGVAGFSRTVAIKRLHPQYAQDPEFLAMFLDEARLAARIRHPNVVPTLDVITNETEVFLVLEYVQGESLAKLLRAVRGMMTSTDTRVMTTIMAGVLHGLHAAHEAVSEQGEPLNIVHRDVSPQNILVGVDGVARLLDFGVARAVGRLQTTRQGQLKGKIAYMAPEQLHNLSVTRQSDIYSAAVVAWEALTGQRLFSGDNQAALATAVLQAPVRPPSQVAHHVPLAIDRVVMRGLQRDPARRYASAREMALDLERSAGVAPASEVGTWVESLARDELSQRAVRIAEIESVSSSVSSNRTTFPHDEMPTVATSNPVMTGVPLSDLLSEESSIVVAPPIIARLPRTARRRLTFWVTLGAAVLVAAIAVVRIVIAGRSGHPSRFAADQAAQATQPPVPAHPPASSQPSALEASAPSSLSPAGALAASASAQRSGVGSGVEYEPVPVQALPIASTAATRPPRRAPLPSWRSQKKTGPSAAAPTTAPTTSDDCDPPFTIDDRGHKHYKPACL
jgi:serine/threonine-protein kinase